MHILFETESGGECTRHSQTLCGISLFLLKGTLAALVGVVSAGKQDRLDESRPWGHHSSVHSAIKEVKADTVAGLAASDEFKMTIAKDEEQAWTFLEHIKGLEKASQQITKEEVSMLLLEEQMKSWDF
jgi:hypothetical protein